MKVKILGKYVGSTGMKSILVVTEKREDANKIAINAGSAGATEDQISKLITKKDYEGVPCYSFFLNCSNFTFERIGKFGILDCDIVCAISAKGFLNAKIQIIDKKEQVSGYKEPEGEADGWSTPAPTTKAPEPYGDGSQGEFNPINPTFDKPNSVEDDLPFN